MADLNPTEQAALDFVGTPGNTIESLPCGCRIYRRGQVTERYVPCLACALDNAGKMLVEAAERIRESKTLHA